MVSRSEFKIYIYIKKHEVVFFNLSIFFLFFQRMLNNCTISYFVHLSSHDFSLAFFFFLLNTKCLDLYFVYDRMTFLCYISQIPCLYCISELAYAGLTLDIFFITRLSIQLGNSWDLLRALNCYQLSPEVWLAWLVSIQLLWSLNLTHLDIINVFD